MQKITVELLLSAYANGYFPMADSRKGTELHWFYPKKRGIIPLDSFHIPKSLSKFIKNNDLEYSVNRCFREVITACATRTEDTWINDEIIDLYCELHRLGFAHSVECWTYATSPACGGGNKSAQHSVAGFMVGESVIPDIPPYNPPASGGIKFLAGGLYGVSLGGAFFGESMFSRAPNGSKCALVHLVTLLKGAGYTLLDTQYVNDHLKQFGVVEIPRKAYLERLEAALEVTPKDIFG